MSVLKADNTVGFSKDAVVLDLGDLGRQAARLRMVAEDKAASIVTEAERKAKQLVAGAEAIGFEQGKEAGYAQGMIEGQEQGRLEALREAGEKLDQVQAAWSDVAEQWDGQSKQMAIEARQVVAEFALKMGERLVHRVIEVDPSVVVDQVAGALSLVLRPLDVSVRINPDERPILDQALPQLMTEFDHLEHIHLVEDAQVSPGGCVVSYGQGQIDATIETQIRRVVDLILPLDCQTQPDAQALGEQAADPLPADRVGGDLDMRTDPASSTGIEGEPDPGPEV